MFRRGDHARVDQAAGVELRPRFLGRAFECEVRELREGRVRRDGAVVPVGGGVVDRG